MPTFFDRIHHICFVVHDIDEAQAGLESMGIGPWRDYPPLAEYTELDVPDRAGFLSLKYRICNRDGIQFQLCQPGPEPTPQRLHLDQKGPGVYHIGFEVPDADAAERDAVAAGLQVQARGRRDNRTGFTYYEPAAALGVALLTRATNRPGH